MKRILVTGANGFVGSAVVPALERVGYTVRLALRRPASLGDTDESIHGDREISYIGDIGPETSWAEAMEDVQAIVHLAGRAHILRGGRETSNDSYHEVNTLGTERLARAAASFGVDRLVFVSTAHVNGSHTALEPFSEQDEPKPSSPYAVSKWQAEQSLWNIATATGLRLTVIRPPLVYGPRVGANFFRLMRWVDRRIPLPLASVHNRRSIVALDNLVDFITRCLEQSRAVGGTYLVSDDHDISTPELIRGIARELDRPARLWPMPPTLLRSLGRLAGKGPEVARLCRSLVVDITKAKSELNWYPPISVDEALARTAKWYREQYDQRPP